MPEQSPNFHLTTRSASFASESPHLNFCTVQVSSHALVCMVQGRRSTITHKLDSEHLSLFVPIEPERGIRRCCCCISLRVCRPCSLVCWWRRGRNKYIDLENTNDQTADTCSRVEAGSIICCFDSHQVEAPPKLHYNLYLKFRFLRSPKVSTSSKFAIGFSRCASVWSCRAISRNWVKQVHRNGSVVANRARQEHEQANRYCL